MIPPPAVALFLLGLLACEAAPEEAPAGWTERERATLLAMRAPKVAPPSPGNAVADSPSAAALGAKIFVDPGFSANGQVSCATCHVPGNAFTDGRATARGIGDTRRNTPTLLGAAWQRWQFWDGRADSPWAQATGPLTAPLEHGASAESVRERILSVYVAEFEAVFGEMSEDSARVLAQVGKALEAFERTLPPGRSRLDAWLDGLEVGDEAPRADGTRLTSQEIDGLRVFLRKGDCASCHHGPLLSDGEFHNLGLERQVGPMGLDGGRQLGLRGVLDNPFNCAGAHSDATRAEGAPDPCAELRYLDPSFPDAVGAFRTPSLRNVSRTAPYMHAGQLATLEEVVEFYDDLPGAPLIGHRELTLAPRGFTDEERASLEAFLRALDSVDMKP